MYDRIHARSKSLMTRDPVHIAQEMRELALNAFVASLRRRQVEVVVASLDDHHPHILARFPDHEPRHWIGLAKKDSSRVLSDRKMLPVDGLWAKRSKCLPICDRSHQVRVVGYLLEHARRGATIWSIPGIMR